MPKTLHGCTGCQAEPEAAVADKRESLCSIFTHEHHPRVSMILMDNARGFSKGSRHVSCSFNFGPSAQTDNRRASPSEIVKRVTSPSHTGSLYSKCDFPATVRLRGVSTHVRVAYAD